MYNVQSPRKVTLRFPIPPSKKKYQTKTDRIFYSVRHVLFLIFLLIKKEILFARIIRPNIFYTFIDFAFIFHLLQVFDYFQRSARTHCIVNQLILVAGQGASSNFEANSNVQYIVFLFLSKYFSFVL